MNVEEIREYCIRKKCVEETFPFDDVTLVFKVLGKMFLMLPLDNPTSITLKCNPDEALDLRDRYGAIVGAYHMNKKYWNQVYLNGSVPNNLIQQMIDHSYAEVVAKLPRKEREKLL